MAISPYRDAPRRAAIGVWMAQTAVSCGQHGARRLARAGRVGPALGSVGSSLVEENRPRPPRPPRWRRLTRAPGLLRAPRPSHRLYSVLRLQPPPLDVASTPAFGLILFLSNKTKV